jgi:hypothetical protein
MSSSMIEHVVKEWLAAYAQDHLEGFAGGGEVREEEQHWCDWLKEQAPRLIAEFTPEARFPASAATLTA